MVCMQWLPGGRTPLDGQYGMCRWTERCQSGVRVQTLDTLDTNQPLLKGI